MRLEAPSLDSFLQVHRLTLASFDGLSRDEALRLADLDDRSLERFGDGVRERSLIVRGALLERLAATGADRDEGDDSPVDDELDPADTEPNEPPKKKKTKKAKDEERDPARPDEDNPEGPQEGEEDDQRTAPPKDTSTEPERLGALSDYERSCRALASAIVLAGEQARGLAAPKTPTASEQRLIASNDAVLLAEVAAGYHPDAGRIAQQILACARKARGEVSSPLPPRGSMAYKILQIPYERHGRKLED